MSNADTTTATTTPQPRASVIATVLAEFSGPLSPADLAMFAELLVGLVRAKLPLPDALKMLARDADTKRLRESLDAVHADVAGGTPLGEALRRRESEFPPLFTRLIEQGVESNDLHAALVELVREYRSQAKFRDALWSQLLSPIATGIVLGAVIFLLAASQLPLLFIEIFKGLRVDLPLPTKFALWFCALLHEPLTAAIGAIVLIFIGVFCVMIARGARARRNFQMFALSLPFIGPFLKTILLGRFCRLLGILLQRRIPLDAALELTRDCFTFIPMHQAIDAVLVRVKNGAQFDEALSSFPLFPPTIVQFVRGGQAHGELPGTLFRLADLYEQRGELDGARVRFLIYVIAQVTVGFAVGLMILAFLLPMFKIQDQLRKK